MLIAVLTAGLALGSRAADARPTPRGLYTFDPIVDGAVITATATLAAFSQLAISSGELTAQAPGPTSRLPAIDRWVAERDQLEQGSGRNSNIFLSVAVALAVGDTVMAGYLDGTRAGLISFALFAETTVINLALVNITKLAVRRPRPRAYFEARNGGTGSETTDSALSFYSGHVAITAGLAGAASYMAFRRYGTAWPSWLTLGVGLGLTTAVAIERVRALAHFPSDVMAGAVVGAAVGVLVPHLHFKRTRLRPTARIVADGGAILGLTGRY